VILGFPFPVPPNFRFQPRTPAAAISPGRIRSIKLDAVRDITSDRQ
jgi:hypothetical protein